jgi:hypothetical protein
LARDYFPQVLERAGVRDGYSNSKWPALAHHLNRWKADGINVRTLQLMMDIFGQHPEWCRRSDKPAWRVFVGRRDTLEALIIAERNQDPGNRRFSTGQGREYWLGRRTSRAYSPA